MKIYLDNCCFNRPFDDQKHFKIYLETLAKLYIQDKIISKKFKLAWSYMIDFENSVNPFEDRKQFIASWKKYSKDYTEENDHILKNADLLLILGLRSKDALHVACALELKCQYFITTDELLIKKMSTLKDIIVINPITFVFRLEELKNDRFRN
jgi:hypothetical protein